MAAPRSDERHGIAVKALILTVPFVALKWGVVSLGWTPLVSLHIVAALLGGVIFTLAIVLSGVFTDFKETERLVSELATTFRRIHADAALVAAGKPLEAMRHELARACATLLRDLRSGHAIRQRRVLPHVDRLDALLLDAARAGAPASSVRTVQVSLGTLVRAIDRLETIVETTFLRAGYVFAWTCVAIALVVLTFTNLGSLTQSLALHGFASFLLLGLACLIYDLDNPFGGTVKVSIAQLEKVGAWLSS